MRASSNPSNCSTIETPETPFRCCKSLVNKAVTPPRHRPRWLGFRRPMRPCCGQGIALHKCGEATPCKHAELGVPPHTLARTCARTPPQNRYPVFCTHEPKTRPGRRDAMPGACRVVPQRATPCASMAKGTEHCGVHVHTSNHGTGCARARPRPAASAADASTTFHRTLRERALASTRVHERKSHERPKDEWPHGSATSALLLMSSKLIPLLTSAGHVAHVGADTCCCVDFLVFSFFDNPLLISKWF